MSKMVLFEDAAFANLLPLVYWRTLFDLRCGRLTLGQRSANSHGMPVSGLWTRAWIADVATERFGMPINQPLAAGDVLVNARWLAEGGKGLEPGPFVGTCEDAIAYVACDEALAERLEPSEFLDAKRWAELVEGVPSRAVAGSLVRYPWDLVARNAELLRSDWRDQEAVVDGQVDERAVLLDLEAIRIERGATVMPLAVLDAREGPIVLEEGATVRPHAIIVGPALIGRDSTIHPHAHVYGGTTIGPACKVGGEIAACIFQGSSNKAHEGFLGHSYVGSWSNIGAGTVNSNLKNTYGPVRVPINGHDIQTDLTFFGAVIGDHAKLGIHQTISTGSVIGFAANVAQSGILPRFVRSFSWLTDAGTDEGDPAKLIETVRIAMARRNVTLTAAEEALFSQLPEIVAFFEPALVDRRDATPESDRMAQTPPGEGRYGGAREGLTANPRLS